MELKITKAQIEYLPCLTQTPFDIDRNSWRFTRNCTVDLPEYSQESLTVLRGEVEAAVKKSVHGMRSHLKDIDVWFTLHSGDLSQLKGVRITSMKKAIDVFRVRFARLKRKQLYKGIDERGETRWLPYYLSSIKYVPPDKWCSGHLVFSLRYILLGSACESSFTLWPTTTLGRSPDAALEAAGTYS